MNKQVVGFVFLNSFPLEILSIDIVNIFPQGHLK